jgi:cold shock CspA family protein
MATGTVKWLRDVDGYGLLDGDFECDYGRIGPQAKAVRVV